MKNLFYYWANNTKYNEGEGILANNFLILLKQNYKSHYFININKFEYKNNFFYNYILPIYGAIKIRNLSKTKKTAYINYLPIWNFFLFAILPQKTILGPITGTAIKKNLIYFFFSKISRLVIKLKKKKILLSNSYFKNYFSFIKKNKLFYDFLLFNFQTNDKTNKKKYDIIFYYKKNNNKGNKFFKSLINLFLKDHFKIAIIGDNIDINNKNLKNFINLERKKAKKIISQSKCGINSKENLYSFFTLDCLSNNIMVFYNGSLPQSKNLKTNLLIKYDYNNLQKSYLLIKNKLNKKINPKTFVKKLYFKDYL